MSWNFSTEPEFERKLEWMRDFVREEVYPLETLDLDYRQFREIIKPLQDEVRAQGLWAAHLGPELGGQGFGQVKLGLMHEILGGSELAPPVFGVHAPDTGNSELLAIGGTEEQKRKWMDPLLANEIWSAYSMTEQGTGSDPTQFTTSAVLDGDEWVVNGTKYCVGNGDRSDIHILMCVTDPDADRHSRASMLIIPTDVPGITTRPISLMSDPEDHGVLHTHVEVTYEDVRVPRENLLGERGKGFALAQKRLGPGRIHHCMRWIGVSRRAFDMLCERAVSKSVHGSYLKDKGVIQNWIAESIAAIESSRLLTLHAAWKIDEVGATNARQEIAMIKYHCATSQYEVLDRAIQIHGALGFSGDLPLEHMYRWARASRLYDGPDEVHKMGVAKRILRGYEPHDLPSEHVPTRRAAALEKYGEQLAALGALA
ncbi:acyl-CoA dehydrogenase [Conexibacter sp. W3-3-2]|uniref:Acyl-CoA dehydrogenase n=1 Tax=Paraconexibacter algicola TaxID=2133960 RepID=A0A2T4ULB7_9ACTN|nr:MULTISPECIES: acyl-CoA dehydrogenase family protein [Solirubrobacterales]MTD46393.1 acyl-CoA dehydrogenase [Conexibacter sp. W3-3-2]PTL60042.1 acyl-CoA dehydrogenase [Paraconexibacter algicola]